MCAVVVEATGQEWPLNLAGDIIAEGGRLVIAGYHQGGPRSVDVGGWNWRGLEIVNAHERDPARTLQGLREAVAAAASGGLDPAPLVTHRFPLERLGEALDATRDKPPGFVKAYVTCI